MRCAGIRAQQRLAGVKTTGCKFSVMALISDPRCKDLVRRRVGGWGKRETITDQMQAVNEAAQGRRGPQ